VLAVFQPHGFGPTRFLWDDYVKVFARQLGNQDSLYLLSIFDAGGTADRTVSSEEMANAINGIRPSLAQSIERENLIQSLRGVTNDGDVVLVMGARDHSLTDLARAIAESL
jgi:UDP-N-acetylmuramate--alanine ligase